MIERDWTPTDRAAAADDERDRNWWRRDSAIAPWPDESEDCAECGGTDCDLCRTDD